MKGHCEIAEAFLRADFSGRPATLLLNSGNKSSETNKFRCLIDRRLSRANTGV